MPAVALREGIGAADGGVNAAGLPAPMGALHFQQALTVSKLFEPHRGQTIRPAAWDMRVLLSAAARAATGQ
jgi:hypothetical protein